MYAEHKHLSPSLCFLSVDFHFLHTLQKTTESFNAHYMISPCLRNRFTTDRCRDIAHLRQECHNSKFGIFESLVEKETFADPLLTGIVS